MVWVCAKDGLRRRITENVYESNVYGRSRFGLGTPWCSYLDQINCILNKIRLKSA